MRFVDSNIFIYVLAQSPKGLSKICKSILKRIEDGEEAVTSTAVVQEVVDWLEYNNRKSEVKTFIRAANSYLTLWKVSNEWKDFLEATKDVDKYDIDFVDALALQIMKREKTSEIYSNDLDFDRVEGIRRILE